MFKKFLILFLLPVSSIFYTALADHIMSDGNGGFYDNGNHILSDGNGGFYR